MAHVTIAGRDLNEDSRIARIRDIIPERPYPIAPKDKHHRRNHRDRCQQCGQWDTDSCCCYSHRSFITRPDVVLEEPRESVKKPVVATAASLMMTPKILENGIPKTNGKKISFGDYKNRKNAIAGASVSPGTTPRPSDASVTKPSLAKEAATHKIDIEDERPTKKQRLSPPIHQSPHLSITAPISKSPPRTQSPRPPFSSSRRSPPGEEYGARKTVPSSLARERSPAGRKSPILTSTSKPTTSAPTHSKSKSSSSRNISPPPLPRKPNLDNEKRSQINSRDDREDGDKHSNKPNRQDRDGNRDHSSSEVVRSKPQKKAGDDLPPQLSPLPDYLVQLAEVYEKNAAKEARRKQVAAAAYDEMDIDDIVPKKKKKPSIDGTPEIHSSKRDQMRDAEPSRKSDTAARRRADEGEGRNTATKSAPNGVRTQTSQKEPSTRSPPRKVTSEKSKPSSSYRDPVVKLRYSKSLAKPIAKILRQLPPFCAKCDAEDQNEADVPVAKVSARKEPAVSRTIVEGSSPAPNTFLSPMPKFTNGTSSLSKSASAATPNRKSLGIKSAAEPTTAPTPSTRPGTGMSGSTASGDRDHQDAEGEPSLRSEIDKYIQLGISLKHESDRMLGLKGPVKEDEIDLGAGSVYAIHCLIAYFIAFELEDEAKRKEKNNGDRWRSILVLIEAFLNSKIKVIPPLHGLLYQLGAICSEKVLASDHYRFASLSLKNLTDDDLIPQNLVTDLIKIQKDTFKSYNLTRTWWSIGHQRLSSSSLMEEFPKAWKRRSREVKSGKDQLKFTLGYYLVPYYLPLFTGSTPLEAASLAYRVTEEWRAKSHKNFDTGLHMKAKPE